VPINCFETLGGRVEQTQVNHLDRKSSPEIKPMIRTANLMRSLTLPPVAFVRSLFSRREVTTPADRRHTDVPLLRCAEIAAVYHSQRVAGDFYEFLRVGSSRVLCGLFDLAGRRQDTREILIATQTTFRTLAPKLFAGKDFNEAEAMVKLCHQVNRTILQVAGSIRSCPAFIGCYNEDLGTVCYTNAGHTPALLRDDSGITQLEASGLPLGIFSHATQSASTCALGRGAALLLVSRGIVEVEHNDQEFGLEGAKKSFQDASALTAQNLCLAILESAEKFREAALAHNDVTALALLRYRDTDPPGAPSSQRMPSRYGASGNEK
jgi:serine phosphatase RsbU (regulator of sigma subunit)